MPELPGPRPSHAPSPPPAFRNVEALPAPRIRRPVPGFRSLGSLVVLAALAAGLSPEARAQTFPTDDPVLRAIWDEGMDNSEVYRMGQTLMDSIGPRLTGSPGLDSAHDWLVATYEGWGIEAENQEYGVWLAWEDRFTHVDLIAPRATTLAARNLAWSPGTNGPVEGRAVTLPDVTSQAEFQRWMETDLRGAFVLVDFPQPTCRPDEYWERHGTETSIAYMEEDRDARRENWVERLAAAGVPSHTLPALLERAGAAGILTSHWAESWGTNRVFSGGTGTIPSLDIDCEHYGLLARLAENGQGPELRVNVEARILGETPTFNTVAMIRGTERPDEYVLLSAHLDTWGGATGATDNGTGTITMLEAMRILKEAYPAPKRTIIVGHWGGEEQGLNGSAAFAEDNPEVVDGVQIVMNQDNGTGRITEIGMQGFLHAGDFFARWLAQVPQELSGFVELETPGIPDSGRSDHASFVCHGVPSFRLGAHEWDYRDYTWHTTRDTFDKISIEEVRGNAVLTAMLAYLASEDPERVPREKRVMPVSERTGEQEPWPECREPMRSPW